MSTHTPTVNHGHAAHAAAHGHDEHEHHDTGGNTVFGFWVYLMSDCLIFASLFATYVVLVGGTDGGPGPGDLFELPAGAVGVAAGLEYRYYSINDPRTLLLSVRYDL